MVTNVNEWRMMFGNDAALERERRPLTVCLLLPGEG